MADTLIICDVDGVLSPDDKPTAGTGGWDDWERPHVRPRVDGTKVWLWLSRHMGGQLASLGDIVWLTSWDDLANRYVSRHLRWPSDLPVIGWKAAPLLGGGGWASTYYGRRLHRWKADGLAAWIAAGSLDAGGWSTVVWIDDELGGGGELDLATAPDPFADVAVPCLRVVTDPAVGLTVGQVDGIRRWLA